MENIDLQLSIKQLMEKYGISQSTAYYWKAGRTPHNKRGRPTTRTPKGFGISLDDAKRIARLSAQYVVGRRSVDRDPDGYDRYQECYQACLIELWMSGAADLALAFYACRGACYVVTRTWNASHRLNANYESFDEEKES